MRPVDLVPEGFAETGLHIQRAGHPPTRFQVIGERSSGTNYVKRLLGRNSGLTPTESLGWKHGTIQALAVPRDMAVILCVRNAGDWARSMYAKPWHTPAPMQGLAFGDFLRAPWDTIIDHPKYFAGLDPQAVGQPLQQDRDPATGLPYANLFHLRTGKLITHLTLGNRGCSFVLVRAELAISEPEAFLTRLRAGLGLPASDAPLRPVVKRLGARFNAAAPRPAAPDALPSEDMDFLRSQLDRELERRLGYSY
ncbi:hypothetical protein [Thalassovita sp.]|uniref:hypothetical protein n=1 Tax=Thalassovita sp. TaxID=1979401 RepID=UPI0029DE6A0B|nr:hypothetical protein [Thalassovita sp.]